MTVISSAFTVDGAVSVFFFDPMPMGLQFRKRMIVKFGMGVYTKTVGVVRILVLVCRTRGFCPGVARGWLFRYGERVNFLLLTVGLLLSLG